MTRSELPLPKGAPTLVHMLADAVRSNGAGEALVVVGGLRLTYADLAASVADFAAILRAKGSAGQRVGVALPNGADAVIAILGALASGAQVALLNPTYTPRELQAILEDADPLLVVCDATRMEACETAIVQTSRAPPIVLAPPFDNLVRRAVPGEVRHLELPEPQDLAILQYTGGTTGRAKGVDLTHDTVALNVAQREALLPTRPTQERFLCMTPIFHAYATAVAFFPAIYSAGTLVVVPRYNADLVLDTVSAERITLFGGAPTIYNGLVQHPRFETTDFSSLVGAYSGAAPLSLDVLATWERVTRVPLSEGYGLTEATAVLSFNPLFGVRKAGSVGRPLPGTVIEAVDLETGTRPLGPGELGEIRACGPQLMAGYRNNPDETAKLIRDGWLYTGDIGEIDADGYVFIRDRKKDMAIVGGYNVYPREVDEVLFSHPAVAEAVSAGVPDPYRGEVIRACVALRPGSPTDEAELLAHCAANLARYKVPAGICIVDEIAKTAAGKIDRRRTREWLIGRFATTVNASAELSSSRRPSTK